MQIPKTIIVFGGFGQSPRRKSLCFVFLSERQQSFAQKEPFRKVRSPALVPG